jgi:hypothetical protein
MSQAGGTDSPHAGREFLPAYSGGNLKEGGKPKLCYCVWELCACYYSS